MFWKNRNNFILQKFLLSNVYDQANTVSLTLQHIE